MQCRLEVMPTGHLQRSWKEPRPSSPGSTVSHFKCWRFHPGRFAPDGASVRKPDAHFSHHIYLQLISCSPCSPRCECPIYCSMALARVSVPRIFKVHFSEAQSTIIEPLSTILVSLDSSFESAVVRRRAHTDPRVELIFPVTIPFRERAQ